MNYTYDEEGVAFFYFLITALTIYLIPATYSRLFSRKGGNQQKKLDCKCNDCKAKKSKLAAKVTKTAVSGIFSKGNLFYFGAIVALALTLNAVRQAKTTYKPYDPFEVLGVDTSANESVVTKAYKRLSRKFHPDKAADKETAAEKFLEITKAYKALTDPVARKNWEEHGNPDGPKSFSLGIALPAWLVSESNGFWVLALYLLAFGVGIPYMVSRWWTHTKLYTKDNILHSSMALFFSQLKESMTLKKVLDLLASSHEFREEIPRRASDAAALEELVKDMIAQAEQQGGEKYEKPKTITEDYASKAHALLFAHFNRFDVKDSNLRADQERIVSKACHLVLGMLQIALARQWLQTANHCITLVQMLVQACPENPSPLLQLPHIDAQIAKHARGRKTPIRSVRQLLEMPEDDRRSLLRTLSDDEYKNLVTVAKTFPEVYIENIKFITLGQAHVIPGGLVTVKIKLRIVTAGEDLSKIESEEVEEDDVENFEFDEDGNLIDSAPIKSISPNDPRSSSTVPIHCPHFPNEKRPFWWVVLTNISNTAIVTPPIKVFDLTDTKTVTLQFTAPNRPGQIAVNVHVKSDSLVGADVYKACTVNIMPAKQVPAKEEQWDISGEESDASSAGFDSDYDDDGAGMGGRSGGGCGDIGCGHAH